jgi:UDP-galactopyranose mutase
MSRFARDTSVFVIEEPVFDGDITQYVIHRKLPNLHVMVPHLPAETQPDEVDFLLRNLLSGFLATRSMRDTAFWYYTPTALAYTSRFNPAITIFDCVGESSALCASQGRHRQMEQNLFSRADIVFAGGHSLYESKKNRHVNIHGFPGSVDYAHFSKARNGIAEPDDHLAIAGPRLGYFGVIDERFDGALLKALAERRPQWQFIIIGPVARIDAASLPQAANIHYLGGRSYEELPAYLKGWDIAIQPFAMNDSTRYISPAKTAEYLAGGKPVISSPIHDVQHPYGDQGLVHIAATPDEWIAVAERLLHSSEGRKEWLSRVDSFLSSGGWEQTYTSMKNLILATLVRRN